MTVTTNQINQVRQALLGNTQVMRIANGSKLNTGDKALIHAFFETPELDERLSHAINNLKDKEGKMPINEAIAKLSYSIPDYRVNGDISSFDYEHGKAYLANTVLHELININALTHTTKRAKVKDDYGQESFVTKVLIDTLESTKKDLIRGIHTDAGIVLQTHLRAKVGGKSLKITKEQKAKLARVSSKRLRLIKTSEDTLRAYLTQTAWYVNALEKGIEDRLLLKERVEKYIEAILELQEQPVLFLSGWYDTRYRLYYDCVLAGINPHGKTFETSQWELADAKLINAKGHKQIVHSLVTIAEDKKMSIKQANKMFNPKKHVLELATKPMNMDKEFYVLRLIDAYNDSVSQTPSRFLLSKDATTGGLQHHGIGFKSPEMMKLANVGGLAEPQDAHQDLANALGVIRDVAKDVNAAVLHGATIKGTLMAFGKSIIDWTRKGINPYIGDAVEAPSESEFTEMVEQAYGKQIWNIAAVADLGVELVDNHNTSLMFRTIDGWKAQSIAYTQSAKLDVYYLSTTNKKGFGKRIIIRDMPLHYMIIDDKREYVIGTTAGDATKQNKVKVRGLDANITHADDAYCLRGVEADMYKHDNFLMHANDMDQAESDYKDRLLSAWSYQPYHSAMRDLAVQFPHKAKLINSMIDSLTEGKATSEMIDDSEHYLSA